MAQAARAHCDFNAGALQVQLNVIINADPGRVEAIVERVLDISRQMECAKGKEHEIEMSVREALANAIVHGCQGDRSKRVQCCVACDPDHGMLIVIRDPGEGFDPASIPSPIVGENVFLTHGRGIFLINQLMDHVEFAHGGTEIRMHKR